MSVSLLVERFGAWLRVTRLEAGRPVAIRLLDAQEEARIGAVYLARVRSVQPSVGAAFVDIGGAEDAFLPLEGKPLQSGAYILAQGYAKETGEGKAFRVRREIQLPGRFAVLLAGQTGIRISKKIADRETRERLRSLTEQLIEPGNGLLLRTEAKTAEETALTDEIERLQALCQTLCRRRDTERRPSLLWAEHPIVRILGEPVARDAEEIIFEDEEDLRSVREAQTANRIRSVALRLWDRRMTMADVYGLDAAIERALGRVQWLPGGGSCTVDYAEALTLYDVNSSRAVRGDDPERTALEVNLEAMRHIAAHLRLCDIGGMVVIDSIDMKRLEDRERVLRELRDACRADETPVDVIDMTPLGLVELTRRRQGMPLPMLMRERPRPGRPTPLAERISALGAQKRKALAGLGAETIKG